MVERKLKKSVENPVKKTGENLRDLQEEVKEDSVTMGLNNIKKQMEEESHEVDKLRIDLIKLMNQVDENSLDLENRANALKSRLFLREWLINDFNQAKKQDKTLYFNNFKNKWILDNLCRFTKKSLKFSKDNEYFTINFTDSKWVSHAIKCKIEDYVSKDRNVDTTKLLININKSIKKVEWFIEK